MCSFNCRILTSSALSLVSLLTYVFLNRKGRNVEKGCDAGMILIGFQKTFDTIDQDIGKMNCIRLVVR